MISDTHGLLRPEAIRALGGCACIIHAGDIGRLEVLDELQRLAPTFAVRGNVDNGSWAQMLPSDEMLSVNGVTIHVLHDLLTLDLNPAVASVSVVISGHSHQSHIEKKGGVLYLNPGAAGPRRFRLPVTLARLEISAEGEVSASVIGLLNC